MLKKIALLVVMFALPLGAMAQTKFAHMNSQEVIITMPEYTKAQADLDAMSKEYQTEMQRTQEEFNKKYQEFLAQADSLPKNIAERRQKELQDMAQRQEQFQQEAYQSMQKAQQDAMTPIYKKHVNPTGLSGKASIHLTSRYTAEKHGPFYLDVSVQLSSTFSCDNSLLMIHK